jgi:CheY-like chemotaxis protein
MPVALVVEDNRDLLGLMSLVLRHAGWVVLPAADAATAMRLTSAAKPDIAFTDYAMPGKNGIELAADLHRQPGLEDLPVVVVTGQPSALRRHETDGHLPGVWAVMTKPVSPQQLEAAAASAHVRVVPAESQSD